MSAFALPTAVAFEFCLTRLAAPLALRSAFTCRTAASCPLRMSSASCSSGFSSPSFTCSE